jgi:enoyl-CoA hydratase/carnithine racemase
LPELSRSLSESGLRYSEEGVRATVTLCRPETRNAQDRAMWSGLRAVGQSLGADVRVVVVRGEGRSFSSGIDRRLLAPGGAPGEPSVLDLAHYDDDDLRAEIATYQEAFSWLLRPDLVTIAAVQGHAVGAGFQLALSCDLRVLSEDAQLSMKEPALGLVPDLTGTKPLVEAVGYQRALEICATTRMVGAAEAVTIGLALTAVPADQLETAVADLVQALTASVPGAVVETKRLLQSAAGQDLDAQRQVEREAQVRRFRELAALMQGPREQAEK